ncbi:MAG: hypothetical protein NTZ92_05780 [Candidatus Omnitrophica bacterium]|nr:hypothetical protein [Candidatus Omnitrophota bacterium]
MRITKYCLLFLVILLNTVFSVVCFAQIFEGADKTVSGSSPDQLLRPKVDYSAQGLRDPFMGKEGKSGTGEVSSPVDKKPLPALTVQGVIWGGNFPQAIINNKVLKVGDTIEGVKIKSIAKEGIIVLFEGSESIISSPAAGSGAGTSS